ncbi:MAG TPA: FAD-dependent oxidoreductase [Patescibacteria group bacterium]|nr:FAD-dependent oxidoreductase [Patescibacteria group bacterium]
MLLKLIEKKQEAPDVTTFVFEPQEKIEWLPGQYLHYVLHHEPTDDRGSDRWFTNSASPFEKNIHITTRHATEKSSTFKTELFKLEVDKEIEISFVEGDFTLDDPEKDHVFIAGGIGVTPYRSILKQLDHDKKPINITLLYANRDQNVVFKEEFEEIASRNPSFKIHYIYSPEHIDETKIKELIPDINKPIFYVSGPEPMVDALSNMLKGMGIAANHIKGDWFPGYPAE